MGAWALSRPERQAPATPENGLFDGAELRQPACSRWLLTGLTEDFLNFKESGRANPLDAFENPEDTVGDVPQHHDLESHQGQHRGQEPMLGHVIPNCRTVRSGCQRPELETRQGWAKGSARQLIGEAGLPASDPSCGWPHSGQDVKPWNFSR